MIKVKATNKSCELNVIINELGRVAKEGEEFEVSNDRLATLLGINSYNEPFVELILKKGKSNGTKRCNKTL